MLQGRGTTNASLMIITDCVTHRDLNQNAILSDREFRSMAEEAGIDTSQVFITALVKDIIHAQDPDLLIARTKREVTPNHRACWDRFVEPKFLLCLESLEREIDAVKPKVILGLGNAVLFALTGKFGIKSWRSSILKYTTSKGHSCYVIPTYTPGYIYAVWKDRQVCVHDYRKAAKLASADSTATEPEYTFEIEPSFSTVARCLDNLFLKAHRGKTPLSVDVETRGGHLACVGIAWSETEAICIPFMRASFEPHNVHYFLEEEESFISYKLYKLLTHPNVEVIGQNFIYDAQYFYRWLFFIPNFTRDTMLAQHSIFSTMPKGLDFLSSMYASWHVYWKDESKNWDPKLGERQLWIYNCKDCCITFEIDKVEQSMIDGFTTTSWPKLRSISDFQQSMFWPVLESMNRGIRVNNASKTRLSSELAVAIEARNERLTQILGHPINIKSPKQMQDLFYRELDQRPVISRKTGNPTTDDSALEKLGDREALLRPVTNTIRELRSLGVFRSTFLEAPVDIDDRMRCSFNIAGTETYRFSSSENAFGSGMNLQNIPSGDEASGLPNVRKLFIPDPDHEFFDIDLDSADLRIVVYESDCREMKQMFSEGLKPYVEIAKEYHRDPTITKSHPSYKLFKALCHGTNYLGTASGLSSRIGLLTHEVERIQNWYYSKFPEIRDWQECIKSQVASRRYVENVFGYRCYFFDRIEGTIFNQAVAWIPQSSVGCLINRGYQRIYREAKEIQVLLQVHDSLAGQYPAHLRDESVRKIIDCCSVTLPYSDPLTIPVGIKTSAISWGDCE